METNVPIDSPVYSQGLSNFMWIIYCLWPMVKYPGILFWLARCLFRLAGAQVRLAICSVGCKGWVGSVVVSSLSLVMVWEVMEAYISALQASVVRAVHLICRGCTVWVVSGASS